jgi:hypothetical protein
MSTVTVTYDTAIWDGQDDSAWYCFGDVDRVATITDGVKEFQVLAVGEMRLHIPEPDIDGLLLDGMYDTVRYTDALMHHAKTDTELEALTEHWKREGIDIWVNNNWFEVVEVIDGSYVDDGIVCDGLAQAVEQAKELLVQVS